MSAKKRLKVTMKHEHDDNDDEEDQNNSLYENDEHSKENWLVDEDGNTISSNNSFYNDDESSNNQTLNNDISSNESQSNSEDRILANLTSSAIEKSKEKLLKKEKEMKKNKKLKTKQNYDSLKASSNNNYPIRDFEANSSNQKGSPFNKNDSNYNNNNNNNFAMHQPCFVQDMFDELNLMDEDQIELKKNDKNQPDNEIRYLSSKNSSESQESDEFLEAFNKKTTKHQILSSQSKNVNQNSESSNNDDVHPKKVAKLNPKIENFLSSSQNQVKPTKTNKPIITEYPFDESSLTLKQHVETTDSNKLYSTIDCNSKKFDVQFYITDVIDHYYTSNNTLYFTGMFLNEQNKLQKCCVRCEKIMKSVLIRPSILFKEKTKLVVEEFMKLFIKNQCINMIKYEKKTKKIVFNEFSESEDLIKIYFLPSFLKSTIPHKIENQIIMEIFGSNESILEQFLIENQLRLPQWIQLKNIAISDDQVTWSNNEFVMDYYHNNSCNLVNTSKILDSQYITIKYSTIVLSLIKFFNLASNTLHIIGYALSSCRDFKPAEDYEESNFNYRLVCFCPLPDNTELPYDWKLHIQSQGKNFHCETLPNERAILGSLLSKLQTLDPDIIFGYDLSSDASLILARLKSLKVPHFSKLGRLRVSNIQNLSSKYSKYVAAHFKVFAGRLLADSLIFAKELTHLVSYSINSLFKNLTNHSDINSDYFQSLSEIEENASHSSFKDSESLYRFLQNYMFRNVQILQISKSLLFFPLACKISNICGMTLSKVLQGGRAIRCEFLLLHAFYKHSVLPPELSKTYNLDENHNTGLGSSKAKYSGGMVLEPKVGFYPNFIAVLDFNSLYPSLMMEYNICFTTLLPILHTKNLINSTEESEWIEVCRYEMMDQLKEKKGKLSLLPSEIQFLVEKRFEIKQQIASLSSSHLTQNEDIIHLKHLNIEQQALKLIANSIYGCLGFKESRFFAQKLAQMVTKSGRDALLMARGQSEKLGYPVIYGDTDSIMINLSEKHDNIEAVQAVARRLCNVINGKFRVLKIDVDHLYKNMLLLKKKKYAALNVIISNKDDGSGSKKLVTFKKEMKGLDIVRRDWSTIAKIIGNKVIDVILEAKDDMCEQILKILHEYRQKIEKNEIPLQNYQIYRQLNKNPEDYTQVNQLPHVAVALRMNSVNPHQFKNGSVVPFLIGNISDLSSKSSNDEKPYHISEIHNNSQTSATQIKPSLNYYLKSQIKPVVERIVAPLGNISNNDISLALGISVSHQEYDQNLKFENISTFSHKLSNKFSDKFGMEIEENPNLNQFSIPSKCQFCQSEIVLLPDCFSEKICKNFTIQCKFCSKSLINDDNGQLCHSNAILAHIQLLIAKFYSPALVCSNHSHDCDFYESFGTLLRPHLLKSSSIKCPQCHNYGYLGPKLTNESLHTQIAFILDLAKQMDTNFSRFSQPIINQCSMLLYSSHYYRLDLKEVFHFLKT